MKLRVLIWNNESKTYKEFYNNEHPDCTFYFDGKTLNYFDKTVLRYVEIVNNVTLDYVSNINGDCISFFVTKNEVKE